MFFRYLFWTETIGCAMKRYFLSTGEVSVAPASLVDGCVRGSAIDTSKQRIYWFSSAITQTLHSMDYHGTNKHTHYVEKKQGINAYSLVKVDSLLIWGGANICMKIHDVLNNVTHLGNCSQRRLTAFAFYENGKQKRLYWKKESQVSVLRLYYTVALTVATVLTQ